MTEIALRLPPARGAEAARRPRTLILGLACVVGLSAAATVVVRYVLPTTVPFEPVAMRSLTFNLNGPGILDATGRVTISSRMSGQLYDVTADRNDHVTKGMVMARITDNALSQQLAAAQANARSARSAILELRAQQASAEALLRRATGQTDRQRVLSRSAVVSRNELEIAETALQQARAEVDRLSAATERAVAQFAAAQAEANAMAARLDDLVITAPINGIVIARSRNPGDMVSSGEAVFHLVDPTTLIVAARFDEGVMGTLNVGLEAKLRFNSDPQHVSAGRVYRLHRQVDQETREFVADISLSTPPRNWALGQRATVTLQVAPPQPVLAVNARYVARREGLPGVWINHEGRARWQPVKIGILAGDYIEITDGLAAGAIVLDPNGRYEAERVELMGPPQ